MTCTRHRSQRNIRPVGSIGVSRRANEISTGTYATWTTPSAPAPGTLWGTASVWTWRSWPVSCSFLLAGALLPHLEHLCHPRVNANRRSRPGSTQALRPRGRWRVSRRPTGSFQLAICRAIAPRVAQETSIGSPTETRQRLSPLHLCASFTRVSTAIDRWRHEVTEARCSAPRHHPHVG